MSSLLQISCNSLLSSLSRPFASTFLFYPPPFSSTFLLPSLLIPGAVLHTDLPAAAGPAGRDCGHKREIENHAAHAVIRSYQEKHWSEKSRNADQSIWGEKLKPHHNLREGKDYHRQSFYLRLFDGKLSQN